MSSRRSSDYLPNRLSENWWRNFSDRSVQKNGFTDRNILNSDTSDTKTELPDKHWWNEMSQNGSIPFKNNTLKKGSDLSINISANEENSLQAINKRLVKKRRKMKNKNRFLQNLSDKSDWKQNEKSVEQEDIADKSTENEAKSDVTVNVNEIEIPNKPDLFNKKSRSKMRFSKAFDSQARCAIVNEVHDISRNIEIPINKSLAENGTPKKLSPTYNLELPRKDYNLRNRSSDRTSQSKLPFTETSIKTKKIENTHTNKRSSASHQPDLELNKEHFYTSNHDSTESFSKTRQLRDRKLFNLNKANNRQFSDAFKESSHSYNTKSTVTDKLSKDQTTKQSVERNDHLSNISLEQNSKNVSSFHISKTGLKKPLKSGKENRNFSEGFHSEKDSAKSNELIENAVEENLEADIEIPHAALQFSSNISTEKEKSKQQNKLDFSVEKSETELGLQKRLASGTEKTRKFSRAFRNELEAEENLNLQNVSRKSNRLAQDYQIDHKNQSASIENIQNSRNIVENTSRTVPEKKLFLRRSVEKKRTFSDAFDSREFSNKNKDMENVKESTQPSPERNMKRIKNVSNRKHIDSSLSDNEQVTSELGKIETQLTSKNETGISEAENQEQFSKVLHKDYEEKEEVKLPRLIERNQSHPSHDLVNLSPDKNLNTQEKSQLLNKYSNEEGILSRNDSLKEYTVSKSIVNQKEIQQENKDTTDFSSITSIEQSEDDRRQVLFHLKRKVSATRKRDADTLQEKISLEAVNNNEKSKNLEINSESNYINTRANDITSHSSVNSHFFEKSLISSTKLYEKKSDTHKKVTKTNRNSKQSTLIPGRDGQSNVQEIHSKSNFTQELQKQHTPNLTRKTESNISTNVSNKIETRNSLNKKKLLLENNKSHDHEKEQLSTNREMYTNTKRSFETSKRLSKVSIGTNQEFEGEKDERLSHLEHLGSENRNSNIPSTGTTGNNISKRISINSSNIKNPIKLVDMKEINTLKRNTSFATKTGVQEEENPFLNLKKYLEKKKSGKIIVKPQMKPLTTYFPVVPKKDNKFPVFNVSSSSKKRKEMEKSKVVNKSTIIKGNIRRPVKLYKKQRWMSPFLYKHIQKAMEHQFQDKTILESENVMKLLGESVNEIIKSRKYEPTKIKVLTKKLAERGIVTTMYDFYNFCEEYLPQVFCDKVIPRAQAFKKETTVPFDPAILFKNITC